MYKYLTIAVLAMMLSLSQAQGANLSETNLEALQVISLRKGLSRLDYNTSTKKWSHFDTSYLTSIKRFVTSKNRHSIMEPLENLAKDVENGYWESISADPKVFHTIRRAYSSLSSLYSFYKIHPDTNATLQANFMARFGLVLNTFQTALNVVEKNLRTKDLYRPMPWFGDVGVEGRDSEKQIGLNYLDMSNDGLARLNSELSKIGNTATGIKRAMEFYPSQNRETTFKSSLGATLTKKPVIVVVHGTFAAGSPEYISEENILFQQTKYMAQSLANDQNIPVEVYSFGWSGSNDNETRIEAGVELANFMNTYFPKEEYNDIYIGHSHGGNVIFHFAKTVRYHRVPEMIVTLATPIRKDFITDNVRYLFEFYAEGDLVQYAGSYEMTARNSTGTGSHEQSYRMVTREDIERLGYFANNTGYDKVKIYATKVLHNLNTPKGALASHTNMKYLIAALPRVLDTLIQYKPNNQFVLNIDLNEKTNLSVTEMDRLQYQILPIAK